MGKRRSWSDEQLASAVAESFSYRSVIKKLGLIPAGGNYRQVSERIILLKLSTDHFTGKGWNQGWKFDPRPKEILIEEVLVRGKRFQSHHLKRRLYRLGLKEPK